jgi:hypothetical protein
MNKLQVKLKNGEWKFLGSTKNLNYVDDILKGYDLVDTFEEAKTVGTNELTKESEKISTTFPAHSEHWLRNVKGLRYYFLKRKEIVEYGLNPYKLNLGVKEFLIIKKEPFKDEYTN